MSKVQNMRSPRQHRGNRRLHGVRRNLTVCHGDDLKKLPALIPVKLCPTYKLRYVNQLEAETVLAGIHRPDSRRRERRAYSCSRCEGWHLTSWSLEDFEARRGEAAVTARAMEPITPNTATTATATEPIPTPYEVAVRLEAAARRGSASTDQANPTTQAYPTVPHRNQSRKAQRHSFAAVIERRLATPLRNLFRRFPQH
ncbi:hypothetical protein AB0N05_13790 [Nocardia sp. NPDC051030]|uniref:hypothetical protein n=1 Tax=Nocardia sp. NPDC051030 TaxID=3155162 RepID=UPI00342FF5BA